MGGAQSGTSGPAVGRGAGLALALLCCLVLAIQVASAQAQAPPIRGLDFRDCVGDNSFPLGPCDGGAPAVLAPGDIVVSPDGRNVYAASGDDSAIGIYDRRAADGSLTAAGCIDDNDPRVGVESCAESVPNLRWVSAVAISEDGRHVVAGSSGGHAVSHFNRDPAGGALMPTGCVADPAAFAGCASTRSGLYRVSDVAISPDSKFAYAASKGSDAIVSFDLRGGGMSAIQCVGDHDSAPPDCPGFARGLAGPSEIVISPDGRNLYAVSGEDGAIGIYRRNATTGLLTYDDCKQGAAGVEGCGGPDEPGLLGELQGIAISADGRSVAVTSRSETPGGGPIANAIASMSRLPIGSIGTSQCFASSGVPFCETIAAEVSHGAVDFSPDGTALVSFGQTMALFGRDPTTQDLDFQGCAGPSARGCVPRTMRPGDARETFMEGGGDVFGASDDVYGLGFASVNHFAITDRVLEVGEVGGARRPVGDIAVRPKCVLGPCELTLRGLVDTKAGGGSGLAAKRRFRFKTKRTQLAAGEARTIELKLKRKRRSLQTLRRLLKRKKLRRKTRAIIRIKAAGPSGVAGRETVRIRLRR